MSLSAEVVTKIFLAFNKLKVFKFDAEINSTFFKLRVDNFNGVVFSESITNNFSFKLKPFSLQKL